MVVVICWCICIVSDGNGGVSDVGVCYNGNNDVCASSGCGGVNMLVV